MAGFSGMQPTTAYRILSIAVTNAQQQQTSWSITATGVTQLSHTLKPTDTEPVVLLWVTFRNGLYDRACYLYQD